MMAAFHLGQLVPGLWYCAMEQSFTLLVTPVTSIRGPWSVNVIFLLWYVKMFAVRKNYRWYASLYFFYFPMWHQPPHHKWEGDQTSRWLPWMDTADLRRKQILWKDEGQHQRCCQKLRYLTSQTASAWIWIWGKLHLTEPESKKMPGPISKVQYLRIWVENIQKFAKFLNTVWRNNSANLFQRHLRIVLQRHLLKLAC